VRKQREQLGRILAVKGTLRIGPVAFFPSIAFRPLHPCRRQSLEAIGGFNVKTVQCFGKSRLAGLAVFGIIALEGRIVPYRVDIMREVLRLVRGGPFHMRVRV